MITVDCSNALTIKEPLLVYVADKLGALPILKSEKFILDSVDDTHSINKLDAVSAIMEFLESVNLKENFQITSKGNSIKIESLDGKEMKEKLEKLSKKKKELFFECTHCGFMTRYEEELKTHRLIHYI
ncbi:C2H2-type zinc finger protein [Nitrosopumilus sp.]|uniref:C2H2-type zinc finger protein n=1 Tax=Nitrosopumilus sp. TaxID=2024843 RepID=UPI002930DD8A|nr:C2H2-type zinc finger protein [Nitrosopumilus sp.]